MLDKKEDRSVEASINTGLIITGDGNSLHLSSPKAHTLQEAITQWQSQTKINLSPNLVLKSREEQINQLVHLLSQSPSKIIIVSPTKEESYSFIINVLQAKGEYTDRVRIVTSQESWNEEIKEKALILIYRGFTPNNIGMAITQGHFVIEAEESINIKDKTHDIIELTKIKKSQQVATLQDLGFDHSKAWKIIEDTKGFLHAIIQHPSLHPYEKVEPDWIEKNSINLLSAILFINSWNRTFEADRKILSHLSGLEYEVLEKELHILSNDNNPPIRLIGNIWQVISKINLFDLIANKISTTQFDKLKSIVLDVLTEIDPAYELKPENRIYAAIYNKVMTHSKLIRNSLADTLVMLSAFGDIVTDNIQAEIDSVVKELMEKNLNIEAWYSYHQCLPILAEASPDSFLSSLENSLENIDETKIEQLFTDSGDLMMGECSYCNLLWALETVSWNKGYLVRVILLLARLSELDIEYGRNNQPFNSLKDIFTGWVVYSSATHEERIGIIENILFRKHPNVTWKLLFELLPDNHSISTGISKPKYHAWADIDDTVLKKDYIEYCNKINGLLYDNLEMDNQNWYDVFNNIDKFYKEYFFKTIDKFMALDKKLFNDELRLMITTTIREKIHRNRSHPDTEWALPREFIDKLEEAFHFIQPEKLIDKYQYLFAMRSSDILNPIPYNKETFTEDHKKEQSIIEELRKEAITHILIDGSFDDLIALIKQASSPRDIGRILFSLDENKYTDIMLTWLEDENNQLSQCSKCYIQNMVRQSFDETILDGLSDSLKSELILAMPFGAKAFELLKKQDANIQQLYWENISWYYFLEHEDIDYFNWVIKQFYQYKVSYKAIEIMSHMFCPVRKKTPESTIDIELLFKILYEMNPNHEKLDRHSTSEVVEFLQKSELSEEYKRFLEWKYLMLKSFSPIYWEKFIIQNPKSFVELVSWIYKPDNKSDENEDLTQEEITNRANNAEELLERVRLFRDYDDINPMNKEELTQWVYEAKEAFIEVDRIKIGNKKLGILLAKSSEEEDELFPNKIVCEVIEEYENNEFDKAFIHEVIYPNGHRSISKGADEGGEQEYKLATKYQKYADKIKFIYPRTASLLSEISDWYLEKAKREDIRNEI